MTRWMRRWLLGVDDSVTDSDVATWTVEDLQCTPDGQVLLLPDTKSIYDLQVTRELELAEQRRDFWLSATPDEGRDAIRQLTGIRPLAELPPPQLRNAGRIVGRGYTIEKLVLQSENGILLPALVWLPDVPAGESVLYLHGQGKNVEAGPNGELPRLASNGHVVLAIDLRGLGETRGEEGSGPIGPNWKTFYTAYLLGQSIVGMRAEDTLIAARYLATLKETGDLRPVRLIASGEAGIPALHAAALQPELFSSVTLRETLTSWTDVVRTPEAENQLINTVHAALAVYDLPNLTAIYGPHRVHIERPVDARGRRLDTRGGASDTAPDKSP
jgi:pimeloyl-ACP methyl ester carboxylesterase